MKKTLLFCALGAALAANAQSFSDFYKVSYNGQTVADGQTITLSQFTYDEYEEDGVTCRSWSFPSVKVFVESTGTENRAIVASLNPDASTSKEELSADGVSSSLCFSCSPIVGGTCLPATPGNFGYGAANAGPLGWIDDSPFGMGTAFFWDIHFSIEDYDGTANAATPKKLDLVMTACDGSIESGNYGGMEYNYTELPQTMTIHLIFTTDDSSVATLAEGSAATRYFSLDGRELTAPEGLCIEMRDGKAIKRIVR